MTLKPEFFADPKANMRVTLLDGVTASGNGEWASTEGYDKISIHLVKASAATLSGAQVYVSNEPAPAANGGYAYGSAYTASAFIEIKIPARWMRVAIGSLSGGAVSAYLEAV